MNLEERHIKYLNNLRDSGRINMFGAAAYIETYFNVSKKDAIRLLTQFMESFDNEEN